MPTSRSGATPRPRQVVATHCAQIPNWRRPTAIWAIFTRRRATPKPPLACYAEAIALQPDLVEARWAHTMSRLPLVYGPGEFPSAARADFAQGLRELSEWFDANPSADGSRAVGSQQPFALAYQDEDNRALLSQYGDLCARLMRDWWERQALAPTRPASHGGAIRVGICSAHVRNHSVWNALVKGWLRHIDRGRFSLHVFHTGAARDAETEYARSRAAHFEQGRHGLRGWVNAILGQHVDVLIYPEIGMDQMTAKLASLRLAPVQAANSGSAGDHGTTDDRLLHISAGYGTRERGGELP